MNPDTDTNHLPPHSDEAERAVLSAILQNPAQVLPEMQTLLREEHFYHPCNLLMWQAIVSLADRGLPIDFTTIVTHLRDAPNGALEKVGGAGVVSEMTTALIDSHVVPFYVKVLKEKHLARRALASAAELRQRILTMEHSEDIAKVVAEHEASAFGLVEDSQHLSGSGDGQKKIVLTSQEMAERWVEVFDKIIANRGKIRGLQLGIQDLDRAFGGFCADGEGDMLAICAQPGMGKSAFGLSVVESLAVDQQQPGMVFPFEMGPEGIWHRLVPGRAGVDTRITRNGFASRRDLAAISPAVRDFQETNVLWTTPCDMEIADLRAQVQVAVRRHGIKWILIDHFGQLKPSSKLGKSDTRLGEIEVMEGLHALRRTFGLFVILLFQLNKEGTSKPSRQLPTLSDIKGASEKTEYPTHVMFLNRPVVHFPWQKLSEEQQSNWEEITHGYRHDLPECWCQPGSEPWLPDNIDVAMRDYIEHAVCCVRKNRHGPTPDHVPVRFIPELQRFRGRTTAVYSNNENNRQVTLHGF